MHVIGIIGEPGSGKSTLLRALRPWLGPGAAQFVGPLPLEVYLGQRVVIVGHYVAPDPHAGTDWLDPRLLPWLRLLLRDATLLGWQDWTLLFEGLALAHRVPLLAARRGGSVELLELVVRDEVHLRRRPHETQTPDWLARYRDRLADLRRALPVTTRANDTPHDQRRNLAWLLERLDPTMRQTHATERDRMALDLPA